ncbi:hypothetical protein [Leptospira sp. 85282-16]|uniref:hypothetical protein n=1 Tax=Leptospira sp. 85282-16 TaxID=2971256 RepID=UPI0021C170A0|nr:hypothetical protein [Leptospira sp. 85282-16]
MENNKSVNLSLIENLAHEWDSPAAELAEVTIDSLLNPGLLKEIPVVSSLIAVYKTGIGIRDIIFARKLQSFLYNYHKNKSLAKYEQFKAKIKTIDKEALSLHLISIIEKIDEESKIKYLNNLFDSFLHEKINYEEFIHLSLVINSLHPLGYKYLKELAESKNPFRITIEYSSDSMVTILNMAGLIITEALMGTTGITVNKLGQDFYYFGMKNHPNS